MQSRNAACWLWGCGGLGTESAPFDHRETVPAPVSPDYRAAGDASFHAAVGSALLALSREAAAAMPEERKRYASQREAALRVGRLGIMRELPGSASESYHLARPLLLRLHLLSELEAGYELPVRAAEIRHDQNRFIESAELYLKAGCFESAGSIFSQQDEFGRSGEAYAEAGNHSVAAEMFERAEDHTRAATSYDESGFPRHAAKNYVKCEQWANAARCLEQSIVEESHGGAVGDPRKRAEIEKLDLIEGIDLPRRLLRAIRLR